MRPRLEVTIAPNRISAQVKRGRRTLWSDDCVLRERDGLAEALSSLRGDDDFPKQCQEVRFCVQPPLVQLRTLTGLPPVRGGELRRVVEQQSNRFFRRRNSRLIIDAKWQDRKNGSAYAGAIDAELVEMLQRAAADSGLTLVEILAVRDTNMISQPLRLAGSDRQNGRRLRMILGTILVSAWICGSYVAGYVLDLELDRRRLAREVETLRPDIQVLDAARREIADVVNVVGAIEARELRRGWVSGLLARLAQALPGGAHVAVVTGTPDHVTMELRARDLRSAMDALISNGLSVVVESTEAVAADDAEGDEWRVATIQLNGGLRAGS